MSGRRAWKAASSLLLLASGLAGCATQSDVASIKAEGNARHVPLMIYDTSWNNPYPMQTFSRGSVIGSNPSGSAYVQLVNTQDRPIEQVLLTLSECEFKGDSGSAGLVLLRGPFQPGDNYRVTHTQSGAVNLVTEIPLGIAHMKITAIKIIEADGVAKEYTDDVSSLFSANISNFCPSN